MYLLYSGCYVCEAALLLLLIFLLLIFPFLILMNGRIVRCEQCICIEMAGERAGDSNTASSWPLSGISYVRVNLYF